MDRLIHFWKDILASGEEKAKIICVQVIIPAGDLILMLRAYLDRGHKEGATSAVVCVATVVFEPTGYKRFVRP